MNEKFYELHKKLVQQVIDYCKENDITDADIFDLHIDGLRDSIENGKWHPGTDSAMGLYNKDKETITYSI
jgi:hypothetical protein